MQTVMQMDKSSLQLKISSVTRYLPLVILILVASALRFYKLGEWSFWIEEHHTLKHTAAIDSVESMILTGRPVFYLLSKPIFMVLGVDEWSARLLPTLIGIVSIPILYVIAKRLFGVSVALLATTLLVVAPWHLYWSQNARFYTLTLLLFSLSAFAFYRGIEKDSFWDIATSIVLLAVAGATHGIAVLLLPIYAFYFVLLKVLPFEKPLGLRWKYLLSFFILPLLGYLIFDAYRILLGEIPFFDKVYMQFFNEQTATFIGLPSSYILLTSVVHPTGTPVALLAVLGSTLLLSKKSRIGLFLSLAAFTPLGIIMLLTPFASTSNRYVFMALFFWLLLAAFGITELYRRAQKQPFLLLIPLVGFAILFLRDPAIEDLIYYLGKERDFVLLFTLFVAVLVVSTWIYWRLSPMVSQSRVATVAFFVVGIVILHAVAANSIYYLYQDGHRENWPAATALVRAEKEADDLVMAAMYVMGSYYMQEQVRDVQMVDLDTILQEGKRVWLIEDEYMNSLMGRTFDEWAAQHCKIVGNWDHYNTGRIQQMRVHLCESTS